MLGVRRDREPTTRLTRSAAGCMTIVVGVTVAAIALAIGLFVWLRHTTAEPPAPNPAAFARSPATRHADAADSAWIGQQFTRMAQVAPQLTAAGRSLLDVCSVQGSPGGLFGGGTPFGFTCDRTDTRYFAFAGPIPPGIRELEQALRRLGWGMFSRQPSDDAPAALPAVTADPVAAGGGPPTGKTGLEFSWAARAAEVSLERDIGAVPAPAAPRSNTYIAVQPPSGPAILSRLSGAHPHLLIISVTVTYADRSP